MKAFLLREPHQPFSYCSREGDEPFAIIIAQSVREAAVSLNATILNEKRPRENPYNGDKKVYKLRTKTKESANKIIRMTHPTHDEGGLDEDDRDFELWELPLLKS